MAPEISFNTNKYARAHGKEPRGKGMWWFEFLNGETFTYIGTLAEAKAACAKELKMNHPEADFITVYVLG